MQDLRETVDSLEPESKPLHFYVGASLRAIRVIWERRSYVARVTVIAAVLAAGLTLLLPKRYTATTCLMPPDNSSAVSGLSMMIGLSGSAGSSVANQLGDMFGMQDVGQLYIRALQSRSVQDRIIKRFDLLSLYKAERYVDARKVLADRSDFNLDQKSGVISIEVTDRDANRAAQMADAYVKELDRLLLESNTQVARRERQYYEEQLAAAKADMQRAAKDFSDFSGKNVAIDVPEQSKVAVEAIATIKGQLIAAEAQMKGLLQIYRDDQGPVKSLRAQISELRRQLAQLGGKEAGASEAFPDIKKLSALGVPYLDLYQRLKIQQAVVEAISQQYELAKLQELHQLPSVRVMDAAEVPEKKSFPPRALIVIFCAWLAFCGAAARAIAADWWARADAEDPWKQVLGPVVAWHRALWQARYLRWLRRSPGNTADAQQSF